MKNILIVLSILIANQAASQATFTMEVDNKSSTNPFDINNFYFIHHIFADAFFMTGLHKQLDYDDMSKILLTVQNGVTLNDKLTLIVPQKEGSDAKIVFMAKDHSKNGKTFVMLTNFNKTSGKFAEFDGTESLVRWYFIRGDKLVYRKDQYSKSEERKKKKAAPHELIDYYLFDDKVENDSQVKNLIDNLLENETSKIEQLYGRLYLGEYYLLHGELAKAEEATMDLKKYFEEEKEIPRQYSLIVDMGTTELELMKRRKLN